MNFLRWLCFWPVSMTFGFVTGCTVLLLGGLLLGHWWFTGCLVIAVGSASLPIFTSFVASGIAPRINKFTVWSILLPCLFMYMQALITIGALVFGDYEGLSISSNLFSSVSPWWSSLSCNLGWMWGIGFSWKFWEFCQEDQALYDHYWDTQFSDVDNSPSGGAAEAA